MPKFSLRTLLAVVVVCALLAAAVNFVFIRPNADAEFHIRNAPIQTLTRTNGIGTVISDRVTYSIGQYGVTEFGNIRLAVRGCTFSGESKGGITLASQYAGGGAATGTGNRRFAHDVVIGGSKCSFGGLSFSIIDSELRILDKKIAVNKEPTLVLVNSLSEIETVCGIGKPNANDQ